MLTKDSLSFHADPQGIFSSVQWAARPRRAADQPKIHCGPAWNEIESLVSQPAGHSRWAELKIPCGSAWNEIESLVGQPARRSRCAEQVKVLSLPEPLAYRLVVISSLTLTGCVHAKLKLIFYAFQMSIYNPKKIGTAPEYFTLSPSKWKWI